MAENTFAATGRRKESSARVAIVPGKGEFQINGRPMDQYLTRQTLVSFARQPLEASEMTGRIDIRCQAKGGGLSGQAGAIRLALSRALVAMDDSLRPTLRKAGLLTVDSRKVERKKYGQPKARKRFQYSKR
ncbi:30S ribosomal protein S9 [candidate division GN15 bacterium]|jgi:small subunit ribosomal protein S9|nr:30S ribosomal protein S9 [candidate division GN15 bacterium]